MIKEKVFSHLLSVSNKSSYIIMEFISERRGDMRMLSSLFSLNPDMDRNLLFEHFRLMKQRYNVYLGFMIADENGDIFYSSSDCFDDKNPLYNHAWFVTAKAGDEFISDVFLVRNNGRSVPAILISLPITVQDAGARRVLAACVDFSKIDISLSKTEIGATGEVYLVNKEGRFITSSRLGARILEDRVPIKQKIDPASPQGVYELIDYRGERVLHAYNEITDHSWIVIAEQDKDEALRQINMLNRKILLLGVLLVILIFTVAFLISERIVKFIENAYSREKELEFQVIQKEKLAALGLLTAGLAHELNTPLANALLYTQMVAEDIKNKDDAEYLEKIATIEGEIKHGSNIVRNLLDFSRHTHGDEKTTDVNDIIDKLVTISHHHCSSNNILVIKELQKDIPAVRGEPSIVQEVITNIFANACDVMRQGGILRIKTRYSAALKKVKIEISDTGPGIPEESINKVFDPFFSTKKYGEGSGLGLFMSYEVIRRLGGTIQVISSTKEGKGTQGSVFTISIPIEDNKNTSMQV